MRILYLAATGAADATRASLPFHVAANGSVAEGQECAIVLVGDGTELVSREQAARVEGFGIPAGDRAPAEAPRQPGSRLRLKGLRRRPWGDRTQTWSG